MRCNIYCLLWYKIFCMVQNLTYFAWSLKMWKLKLQKKTCKQICKQFTGKLDWTGDCYTCHSKIKSEKWVPVTFGCPSKRSSHRACSMNKIFRTEPTTAFPTWLQPKPKNRANLLPSSHGNFLSTTSPYTSFPPFVSADNVLKITVLQNNVLMSGGMANTSACMRKLKFLLKDL